MLEIALEADEEWDSSTAWEELARAAAKAAVAESAFPDLATTGRPVELSIRLSTDAEVRQLNSEWRGKDKPTNVLSFPLAEGYELEAAADGDARELMLGDVVLAHGVCAAEAADKSVSFEDHAAHLMVHGTLHLLGYDHQDDASAADMEAREARALARLGIANPYEVTA
ncbi:MAG: rRNA maturation RNase YbeY [Sphingomicrobium sp.]